MEARFGREGGALRRLVSALLALLLLAALAHVFLLAWRQPLGHGDYVAIWGLKARAIHNGGALEGVFRVDPQGEFSHPEYPPLWPLLLAGVAALAGRFDERMLAFVAPVLAALASWIAFKATRADTPFRLLAAVAVALLPYFHDALHLGYAEPLLLVLALAALNESDRLESRGAFVRFAGFLVLAAWAKQEGAVLGLAAALTLLAAGRVALALRTAGAVFLLAVLPWQLVVRANLGRSIPSAFDLSSFALAKVDTAGRALLDLAVLPNLWWIAGAGVLLALSPSAGRRRGGTLVAVSLYALLLGGTYAFSRFEIGWHVANSWDRLAFVPVAILLVVLAEAAAEARATPVTARSGR